MNEALFAAERPRLVAIAYRMLGTMSDAEDAVQEAFLRFGDLEPAAVRSPPALLTTIVTRICLDVLKSARARRETYEGPWLPEPVRTEGAAVDPESISMAFLVLLETLSPEERAIYILCEVFDYAHDEVAAILGKSKEACRQALHRAKQRVAEGRPRFATSREEHERIVFGFLVACQTGDVAGMRALLADDVVAWSDGGGKVAAARKPVHGSDAVARFILGLARRAPAGMSVEVAEINGMPGVVIRVDGCVDNVTTFEVEEGKIRVVRAVRNPEKLARV